jgi:hypothetical protein
MVLPSGVNKATGLNAALRQLGLSVHNTVAVGDAENDHAFLKVCERAVAVANALPALKSKADLVTNGASSMGVAELIGRLLQDDLASVPARNNRDTILLGETAGKQVRMPAYGTSLLIPPGADADTSPLITGLMGRLSAAGYQFLSIDPSGRRQAPEGAVILGDRKRAPVPDEVTKALSGAGQSVMVNLLGVPLQRRPAFFENLLPRVREMRLRTGRPHWVIVDGAYHLLPVMQRAIEDGPVKGPAGAMLITMDPGEIPPAVLCSIDTIVASGNGREDAIQKFCTSCEGTCPPVPTGNTESGTALLWSRKTGGPPLVLRLNLRPDD